MRSAYPTEWLGALDESRDDGRRHLHPGHGFTETGAVSKEELHAYHKAMHAVIAEATRLTTPACRWTRRSSRRTSASTLVDARLVAGADRHPQGLRRTRRQTEIASHLNRHDPRHATMTLPTFADVESAATQIAGAAHRTPVVTSRTVNARTGAAAVLQVREPPARRRLQVPRRLQRAVAPLRRRTPARRRHLLVRQPRAGDRARRAAARHPARHRHAVRRARPSSVAAHATATAAKSSSTIAIARIAKPSAGGSPANAASRSIPPYDHPHIIAGQGTAARRAHRRSRSARRRCSCRAAAADCSRDPRSPPAAWRPAAASIGVEPAAGDDATRSFRTKQLQTVDNPQTVADGARTPSLGSLTFPLVLQHVSDMTTVDDADAAADDVLSVGAAEAGRRTDRRARRGGGARRRRSPSRGARVGVILSGGNVDLSQMSAWIASR